MSKCWYCNEELTTRNYDDKHIGICKDCYNGMFRNGNELISKFITKISDLEAKLAESFTEKDVEGLIKDREDTIKFLKQQLAEKEDRITRLQFEVQQALSNSLGKTIKELVDKDNKDKISFAVEKLEKVKAELVNNVSPVNLSYTEYVQEVFNKLNNQIEELKKEMK